MANHNGKAYIGVDLGGTNMQAGVLDAGGKLLARDKKKTKAEEGSDAVIARLHKLIDELLQKAQMDPGAVGGLGIGAPGVIDPEKGVVINAVNLRWNDFPLRKALEHELKVPVVVDNDVNVGVWGEFKAGAGKDDNDLLGIFIGTGIGGGLVLNGSLYYGHHRSAGEIGHTVVDVGGGLGRCTLENLASRTNIANMLRQLIQSNHESVISKLTNGDLSGIRSKVIAEAVHHKDPLTLRVIEDAARCVGVGIANAVTLLSLPCVVVGGGLTEALGRAWLDPVRRAFGQHVFPAQLSSCRVVASRLGDDAGIIGAALLVRAKLGG